MRKKNFLFLQGVCSPFFSELADVLKQRGHNIFKINFNMGDVLYWKGKKAWNFRGDVLELPHFLEEKYKKYDINDVVLFGDCRPIHVCAIKKAKELGIRVYVFEEGYFRPFWITLEREGVNGNSLLLGKTPEWYRKTAKEINHNDDYITFHSPFFYRACHDVIYHTANIFNLFFFHKYSTHAPYNAATEYTFYCKRRLKVLLNKKKYLNIINMLTKNKKSYFFLPLQLDSDAQIRRHSSFNNMNEVIELVLTSFALNTDKDEKILIKNHPLDIGLVNYDKFIDDLVKKLNLNNRVFFVEIGNIINLLNNAKATITVNSTVGILSLSLNCPTLALSNPIYNLDGLTFQGNLNDFWNYKHPPDMDLFKCFKKVVMSCSQINGGFYCQEGIKLGIKNSIESIESETSKLDEWL